MVKITVSNNVERKQVIMSRDSTIDQVIEESGIAVGSARPLLNGEPVYNKTHMTLGELGVGDTAYLAIVANKDNN